MSDLLHKQEGSMDECLVQGWQICLGIVKITEKPRTENLTSLHNDHCSRRTRDRSWENAFQTTTSSS